jgi:hypothetical protein
MRFSLCRVYGIGCPARLHGRHCDDSCSEVNGGQLWFSPLVGNLREARIHGAEAFSNGNLEWILA